MFGATLGDVQNRVLRELLGNRCISRSLVNLQNSTATFDTVTEPDGIVVYTIDGVVMTHADYTDQALTALAALQNPITGYDGYYSIPINTTVYFTVVVNQAGTVYTIQGTYANQVLGGSQNIGPRGDGSIPRVAVPALYTPIAVLKVVNGATAVFIPATTNWNAATVTSYAAAVSVLPAGVPTTATNGFVAGGA